MDNKAALTQGPVVESVLRFGWPLAAAMVFHGLFNCVDLLIVGRLGPGAVAAVTAGGIINMLVMLLANGVTNVFAGEAARLEGRGQRRHLSRLDHSMRVLTWGLSLGLGVAFVLASGPLISTVHFDAPTAEAGQNYLMILSAGSGTMFFLLYQSAALRALGRSHHVMVALVGSNILNLVLDFALVFGWWGCPRLGVAGAAWATVAGRWLGAVYLGFVLKGEKRSWPRADWRWQDVQGLFCRGLGHGGQMLVRVVGLYGLMVIVTRAGVRTSSRDLLDGVGVGIRLEMVIVFCALGWGTALAAFVGQNRGAGLWHRLLRGTGVALAASLLSGLVPGALLYGWRSTILGAVAPQATEDALASGSHYLEIVLAGYPGLIVALVLSQALLGLGSLRLAVVLDALLFLLVLLPLAAYMVDDGRISGAWWSLAAVHLVSAPLYGLTFFRVFRREAAREGAGSQYG